MTFAGRHRAVLAVLLPLTLTACVLPLAGERSGRKITFVPADLRAGRTSKADLVSSLGPPDAVVEPGGYVQVPSRALPLPGGSGPVHGPGGTYVAQGEAWFALFDARRPFAGSSRVYHWSSTSSSGFMVWWLLILVRRDYASMDELWALVDEETGLVLEVVRRTTG